MSSKVKSVEIDRFESGESKEHSDLLAVEAPLEIRLAYGPENDRAQKSLAVTMRTPGDDEFLALGFLFTEGLIAKADDLLSIKHCEDWGKELSKGNVIRAELRPEISFNLAGLERNFYMTSSCGICGKASIEAVQQKCQVLPQKTHAITSAVIQQLPQTLREQQLVFEHTGGIHAAALFTFEGELIEVAEDVGRHNAVDKLIGRLLSRHNFNPQQHILLVSGRASFELVQKAAMYQIPLMAAVGAPSSLAVELAKDTGLALIGFLRENRFNLYTGAIFG